MKKQIAAILIFVLTAGFLFSLSGCGKNSPTEKEISQLVAEAIISGNEDSYYEGECCGEGHKILGSSLSGSHLKVYALTMFGNYGFQNDMFIKVSGSGVIPAVLTFEKDGTEYNLLEIEYPGDGAGYVKSIKKMFPLKYRLSALNCDSAYDELVSQERKYAEEYLQSIGREAEIGEFGDLNVVLLTDLGVSVDVSNRLSCDKDLGEYPFWIGSSEYLENGTRYVRSLSYDENAGQIICSTVEKETGEVNECFVFDATTGESCSAGAVVSQMEPAGLPAATDNTETDDTFPDTSPYEQNLATGVPPTLTSHETAALFVSAYISQDVGIIRSFLSSDFAGDPKDVSPWSRVYVIKVIGADDETTDRPDGIKDVSVEFLNPDDFESFACLNLELIKENDEWRVHSYGLEG